MTENQINTEWSFFVERNGYDSKTMRFRRLPSKVEGSPKHSNVGLVWFRIVIVILFVVQTYYVDVSSEL